MVAGHGIVTNATRAYHIANLDTLLACQIQDHTGVTYATAFQEAGVEMVGHSALDLYNIREEEND